MNSKNVSDGLFAFAGTPGAEKRALYIALRHAQIALDVVVEDDVLDGTLNEYAVLYATAGHVTQACAEALVQWVGDGGTLFAAGGMALLNETNQTNLVLAGLFGIEQYSVFGREAGPGTQEISYIKQDLAYAKVLDRVTIVPDSEAVGVATAEELLVVGEKAILTPDNSSRSTLGHFSDGSAALYSKVHGQGKVFVAAFPVGLAYFRPAMPFRPVARGNTDLTFNHWIPQNFSAGARAAAALPVAGVEGARPVLSSEPRVDIGVVAAKGKGTAIIVTNWTPTRIKQLNLTVQFSLTGTNVTLATGGTVREEAAAHGMRSFIFDLGVADTLIVRS